MYMCIYGGECICCLRCVGAENESKKALPDEISDDMYTDDEYTDDGNTSHPFAISGDKANNDSVSETYETDHPENSIKI